MREGKRGREAGREGGMVWLDIKGINGQVSRPQDIYNWMRNAPQRITAASQE